MDYGLKQRRNERSYLSIWVWNVAAPWPQKHSCVPLWPERQRLQLATPSQDTHTQADSRDTIHKGAESGCYWIKPLLTVLEYDGKNLETQGGLCQQALFA